MLQSIARFQVTFQRRRTKCLSLNLIFLHPSSPFSPLTPLLFLLHLLFSPSFLINAKSLSSLAVCVIRPRESELPFLAPAPIPPCSPSKVTWTLPPSCPEFNTSPLSPSHSCSPPPTSSLVCQQEFPSWSPFPINVICLPPDPDPTSLVITPCSQIPDPSSNPPLVLTPCSPPPSPPQSPRSPLSRHGCW